MTNSMFIAMHALPKDMMPYYLSYFISLVRMLMNIYIFGPPNARKKKDEKDSIAKVAIMVMLRGGLLAMAIRAIVIDAKLLQEIYTDADSISEIMTHTILVIVTSPNCLSALGNAGIADLYFFRRMWKDLHRDPNGGGGLLSQGCAKIFYLKVPPGFYEQVGGLGVAYWYLLWFPYYLPTMLWVLFCMFPCMIVYIWFYGPLYGVLALANTKVILRFMDLRTKAASGNLSEPLTNLEVPIVEVQTTILDKMTGNVGNDSDIQTADAMAMLGLAYEDEARWFSILGFPKFAFTNYLAVVIISPIMVPLTATMMTRFVDGLGYWNSFYITCSERTMAGYVSYLLGELGPKVTIIESALR